MAVFLDPIETGGWLDVLRSNGTAGDAAYGRFVGRRFRSFRNIVWLSGNDFQTWKDQADDAAVRAVALGIRSADPAALQTVELDYHEERLTRRSALARDRSSSMRRTPTSRRTPRCSRSTSDGRRCRSSCWRPATSSNRIRPRSYGDPQTLRRQEYWTALSGATGQFYGNHYTWQFADGWKRRLDTEGSAQLGYLVNLLARRSWFRLVPDLGHRIVTKGYGTFTPNRSVASSDYVTTASTPDGRLAISYLPRGGTIRIDTRRMAGRVHASWYDPTSGRYTAVKGSPFAARRSSA